MYPVVNQKLCFVVNKRPLAQYPLNLFFSNTASFRLVPLFLHQVSFVLEKSATIHWLQSSSLNAVVIGGIQKQR